MRPTQLFILSWLQLCRARRPGFSIHSDLLAHPQFQVVFSEAYISEPDAQILVEKTDPSHPDYEADFASRSDLASNIFASQDGAHSNIEGDHVAAESYEIMSTPPQRFLCAIPVIEPPPAPNKTAAELAKAEQARELARASSHGWEMMNNLEGTCLYYMSGWWSYRFCYGHDIVQFHALPGSVKGGPPTRDPTTAEYVLGRVPDPHSAARGSKRGKSNPPPAEQQPTSPAPPNTDLQVKGDQRYLVQKMGDGTLCDLTNRERTIEVQYHCSPGTTQDRIGWIEEVTTCAYLMVVHTPRLCNDVAFLPPKEEKANVISCRAIVPESELAAWHAQKTLEAQASMAGQTHDAAKAPVTIGGIVVGGRQVLGKGENGKEPPRLAPPRHFASGNIEPLVELVAEGTGDDQGSKVDILTEEELAQLNLSPEMIEQLKEEIQKLAGETGWKLEVVKIPGEGTELRVIEEEEGDGEGEDSEEENGQNGSEEKFFKEEL
ncbi:glucosidase II beta subunit-like protein-domain-containing protein [Xylariomycetidae sp. FL2044]|nr:glucosidase II beta subunit-like protein-domain-containing protein [Xylariomycetidae sp. FL2044]